MPASEKRAGVVRLLEAMAQLAKEEMKYPYPEGWIPILEVIDLLRSLDDAAGAAILEDLYECYLVVPGGGLLGSPGLEIHSINGIWNDASILWWELKSEGTSGSELARLLEECAARPPALGEHSWRVLALMNLEEGANWMGPECLPALRRIATDSRFPLIATRRDATLGLGLLEDPEAPSLLWTMVRDRSEHPNQRVWAAATLGYFGQQLHDKRPSGEEGFRALWELFAEGVEAKGPEGDLLAMMSGCCLMSRYGNKGLALSTQQEQLLRQVTGGKMEPSPTGNAPSDVAARILKAFGGKPPRK